MVNINKGLLKGSFILLIAFNLYNVINFFFQFSMARLLSVIDYGVLATLYSIIYVSGVFSESIQTIIMKYSSSEKDPGKIKNLFKRSLKKGLWIFLIVFAVYLLVSIFFAPLLKISYLLLALTGVSLFSAFLLPVNRGIMLGKKMFKSLAGNLLIESVSKIVLAILLVLLGLQVYGAIFATIMAVGLAFLFSFSSLKPIIISREKSADFSGIYKYSFPVITITLAITAFFSIDVIIAKIVFDEATAGTYALASILAKTIFFGTAPISKAMFPLSAENGNDKKKSKDIILNSIIFLFVCIAIALLAFLFFPDLLIKIFSGKSLPEASGILFLLGVSFSLLSLTNLVLLYKLSKANTRGYMFSLVFVIIEATLLSLFHSSLVQFSFAFIASSVIFLIGSLLLLRE